MAKKNLFKRGLLLSVGAVFLYGALMIILRLRMTELGYAFEEAKTYERALQEEQINLRAQLAQLLSSKGLKTKLEVHGLAEPEPRQIVVIP